MIWREPYEGRGDRIERPAGRRYCRGIRRLGDEVVSLTHSDIELSSLESVRNCLGGSDAAIVVNTAAMHHVEKCEQDPERAFAVNAVGARNLALVTREMGAVLVHISTDYVFDGTKSAPYVEEDAALPLNVYGNSKLAGECFVRTLNPKHFVLRTSAIYGKHPCRAKGGQNFVELMLRLGRERGAVRVVDDERVSPTSTASVARQIAALRKCNDYGLYHATCRGRLFLVSVCQGDFRRGGPCGQGGRCGPRRISRESATAALFRPRESTAQTCRVKYVSIVGSRTRRVSLRLIKRQRVLVARASATQK